MTSLSNSAKATRLWRRKEIGPSGQGRWGGDPSGQGRCGGDQQRRGSDRAIAVVRSGHLVKGDVAAINSEGAAIGPSLWCDNSDGAAIQACGRLWRRRDWSRAADLVLSVADGAAETGWNPG
ncbi:hypothetical protein CASFOL_037817 [Castilleja foliolosa]|uniref:Uncharacterized protein n=1 Tax=Castilleja foliolosa TaxID=1961234 RepID=A0ABD3BJ75_9LAMI